MQTEFKNSDAPTPPTWPEAVQGGPAAPQEGALCYTDLEHAADRVIHILSVGFSVIALPVLLTVAALRQDAWNIASLSIYGVGVVIVFAASAAYNLATLSSWRWLLKRFDHAAIFVKIAGTYTPFAVVAIGGGWGAALLSGVWSIAAVGVPIKLFAPGWLDRAAVWLYLAQGWLVIIAIGPIVESLSDVALALMAAGGVLYTVGVYFFLKDGFPYHNAIWHAFVLAASICMYCAVFADIALAEQSVLMLEPAQPVR